MATATGNTLDIRLDDGKLVYVPDTSGTLPTVQGQLVCFDGTLNGGNGGIRPATAQADLAYASAATGFAGVAEQNSILTSLLDKLPSVRVGFKSVYWLVGTTAEVYKMGTKVFLNETIAGSVTVTSGTNAGARTVPVGYIILPNELMLAGNTSITVAAGQLVPVAIVANYPVASIG